MYKNCKKPLKIIEKPSRCRKFVENLPKLPKTINKSPKTFKNRKMSKIFKKNIQECQKTLEKQ